MLLLNFPSGPLSGLNDTLLLGQFGFFGGDQVAMFFESLAFGFQMSIGFGENGLQVGKFFALFGCVRLSLVNYKNSYEKSRSKR